MTITIFVFGEDELAEGVAMILLDRLVGERASEPWLRELWNDSRTAARTFVPLRPNYQVRIPSGLRGRAKDVYRGYRAAIFEKERTPGTTALVLAFDSDHVDSDLRVRAGLAVVAKLHAESITVVVAEASPEFDAWVLMGHEPGHENEREALKELCDALAFDPRSRPHDLNSTTGNERDAKRVCRRLLCLTEQAHPTHPRVLDALEAPLDLLLERGKRTGVREFLNDIDEHLLPLLGDRSRVLQSR